MKKPTQAQQIKKHLETGASINPLQALNWFGCFRLSARIYDLVSQGMNIESGKINIGSGKYVAEYYLVKE